MNKKNSLILIVIILLFIISAVILSVLYCTNNEVFNDTKYTKQKFREKYIISQVKDDYLDSYLKNGNTLVIFWASWCHYCTEELDVLNTFISQNPKTPVIIVSHDKTEEDLKKYLEENHLNWFTILDTEKTIRQHIDPESNGIPSSYLIGNEGNIINYHKGTLTLQELNLFWQGNNLDNATDKIN
ncbi:MAG: TlpA disulfide reductase family protein [Clostridia bacterium]